MKSITVKRNDTRDIPITFEAGELDITGYTIWFTVREDIPDTSTSDDTDALIAIKQLPAELTDPTNGTTTITLSSSDTNIDVGKYKYDIQYETATGEIHSTDIGMFVVEGDITRST